MRTKRFSIIGLTLIMLVLKGVSAWAVPGRINYQGYLRDDTGSPLSGYYDMTFAIYSVDEGGSPIWSEKHNDVSVTSGIFNVILGQPGNLLDPEDFESPQFLGITVESDPEMIPRQQITSSAFAFRAAIADSVADNGITTIMIADEAVTGAKIASEVVTSSHISTGSVGTSEIEDSSVSSGDVAFNYAGSSSKGGPATDVDCSGCISESEVDFTLGLGDITAVYTENGLSGGSLSGDVHLNVTVPLQLSTGNWKYGAIMGEQTSTEGGYGVFGKNTGAGKNFGYLGGKDYGAWGEHSSGNQGYLGGSSTGVRGEHSSGNYGYLGSTSYGVGGYHSASGNYGCLGSSSRGVFGYSSSGTAGFFDSPTGNGLVVDRGSVGIGTTSPEENLHVQHADEGVIKVGTETGNGDATIIFEEGGEDAMALRYDGESNDLRITDETSGSPRMTIERSSGYVGIGTTSPNAKLEILGDGTSNLQGFLNVKNINNKDAGIRLYDSDTTVRHHIFNDADNADDLRIAPDGSFATGGITVSQAGFVGIGTISPNNELDVHGTIRAEEIIVETGWADYVFQDDYVRMDLEQVEKHIQRNGHLPGIPTEAQVKEKGVSLGAFQVKLLEKIEELTLYLIEQNKKIQMQSDTIDEQNQKLFTMKKELDALRHQLSSSDSML